MTTFIVAQKPSPHGILVIITDPELLGKRFEDEKLQLDFSIAFYQGEEMNEEQLEAVLQKSYVLHISGEKSVAFVAGLGLIDMDRVLYIDNVPHTEVYLGD